jgi:hypothetical protein
VPVLLSPRRRSVILVGFESIAIPAAKTARTILHDSPSSVFNHTVEKFSAFCIWRRGEIAKITHGAID